MKIVETDLGKKWTIPLRIDIPVPPSGCCSHLMNSSITGALMPGKDVGIWSRSREFGAGRVTWGLWFRVVVQTKDIPALTVRMRGFL